MLYIFLDWEFEYEVGLQVPWAVGLLCHEDLLDEVARPAHRLFQTKGEVYFFFFFFEGPYF